MIAAVDGSTIANGVLVLLAAGATAAGVWRTATMGAKVKLRQQDIDEDHNAVDAYDRLAKRLDREIERRDKQNAQLHAELASVRRDVAATGRRVELAVQFIRQCLRILDRHSIEHPPIPPGLDLGD
jgi:formylmethanofuran dehydrogenase subunit E